MLKEADIYRCIQEANAPYIRLFDINGSKLYVHESSDNAAQAVAHLQSILPMFKAYNKIKVQCATPAQFKCHYRDAILLICVFDGAPAGAIAGPQFTPWNMPAGYIHQDVMLAKLDAIEKSMVLNREIDQLKRSAAEKENQDPAKQVEKFFPYALYAMGKPVEEIQKVCSAIRIGNANLGAAAGATGSPATNTLTFKDVENLTDPEKEKKFQGLADSVAKKVSIEEMITLYDAINQDPTLVQTALQALPLLKKS